MKKQVIAKIGMTAKGRVKVQVVENGKVVIDRPWQDNLILNQGMNNLGASTIAGVYSCWVNLMLHCAAGTGTRPTSVSSDTTVGSYSAGVFTSSGGSYVFTDALLAIGSLIKMTSGANSGTVMRITGITNANNVDVVFESGSAAASGTFDVFYAHQVGLETEVAREISYLSGASNCGSSFASNILTHKRTFDFASPGGTTNYSEIGLSHLVASGNNLNMRIKLASPVPVTNIRQLRVVYQLSLTLTPATLSPATANITNWVSTDGDEQWQLPGMTVVASDGTTTHFATTSGSIMEPGVVSSVGPGNCQLWVSTVSTATAASFSGSPPDRTSGSITTQGHDASLSVYTSFDFFRDKTATFLVGEGNSTGIRSMGIGFRNSAVSLQPYAGGQTFAFVFDNAQNKDSLHTLTLTFRFSWARTLA